MPAYHRLDVSADYSVLNKSRFELIAQASVYNAYNRDNTYYIYYETIGDLDKFSIQMIKKYVGLFPILPSFSIQMLIK